MSTLDVSRRRIARTLSTLVALTLAVGVGGVVATSASAAVGTEPRGVTLTWNAGELVAHWKAPTNVGTAPASYTVQLDGWLQRHR